MGSQPKPHKLSTNEVAALVDGLKNFDLDAFGAEAGPDVKPYVFGSDDLSLLGDYYGLRMINERFCRLARSVFLPFLRMHPRISSFPPEVKAFDSVCDELDNFTSLTISRIDELRGTQMIVLPPDFVSLLTDAYYGGRVAYLDSRRQEFTATENRVIEIVTDGLNRALELAWRDLTPLSFTVQNREENLQFATFVDADEMVVRCSFIIQLPEADPANIELLYPLQALKPLASQLRSRMQSDQVTEDESWKERLERAVMSVPLSVSARLAEPTVALTALENVTAGTIVPVDLSPAPKLYVEGRPYFDAEVGDVAGRAALNLTRRLNK